MVHAPPRDVSVETWSLADLVCGLESFYTLSEHLPLLSFAFLAT